MRKPLDGSEHKEICMPDDRTAYCGPAELHDARVRHILRSDQGLTVELETAEGRPLIVQFVGVAAVEEHEALGMMLYALREEPGSSEARRFEFINWDAAAAASLVVTAAGVSFK